MKNSSNVKSLQYWGLLTFWNQRFSTFNNLGLKPQAIDKYMKNSSYYFNEDERTSPK
jgi:hypothetical protein